MFPYFRLEFQLQGRTIDVSEGKPPLRRVAASPYPQRSNHRAHLPLIP